MLRELHFRVPFEDPAVSLRELVRRAWPEGTDEQVLALFESEAVLVDERVSRNAQKTPYPGVEVQIGIPLGLAESEFADGEEHARGSGWILVEKPIGMHAILDRDDPMNPILFLADSVGADRDLFTPVWPMDTTMGGPWLCATTPKDAINLRKEITKGRLITMWSVIAPAPPRSHGTWTYEGARLEYAIVRKQGALAELQLTLHFDDHSLDPTNFVREAMAANDCPVLGDRGNGGHMIAGGLRLRLMALIHNDGSFGHSWNPAAGWWPEHQVILPAEESAPETPLKSSETPTLLVSQTTLDVLAKKGHPWVLADRETGSRTGLRLGSMVRLASRNGRIGPFALINSEDDELAARFWSNEEDAPEHFVEDVSVRLDLAIAKREHLLAALTRTDVLRLVHGQADGLPGFFLDRVGPILRATLSGGSSLGFRNLIYDDLADFDPEITIIEAPHLEDIRARGGELPQTKIVRKGAGYLREGERIIVREHGLRYWAEIWEGIDVGFFADQRDNRKTILDTVAAGENWLNLFCHTGAFSVVLASLGANITSVDLSRRYLDWLDDNLELNQIDLELNTSIAEDARSFVERTKSRYDGIIVDPPTAARSDAGFWSVRKHYKDHLIQCFKVLNPGGQMLVCRNDRKRKAPLKELVIDAAEAANTKIKDLRSAGPSGDFPTLSGFPDGDKFEGVWVLTES